MQSPDNQFSQNILDIYDIFKNFFGEPYVDLQSGGQYSIVYVWFPRVTVTNENNKSVNIQDLYAKIEVTSDGRIPYENRGFLLNRATYSEEQFTSGYMHSHICSIPKHDITEFQTPCLGRGPINGTIATLKNDYDEITWMLFCQELSMYVTVESLTGGPYNRLENIGSSHRRALPYVYNLENTSNSNFLLVFNNDILKDFIKYYLENGHLSIGFKEGEFCSGMPYYDYMVDISNSFIDYYNKNLRKGKEELRQCYRNHILINTVVINGKFYRDGASNIDTAYDIYNGERVLTFKGNDIRLSIIPCAESEATITTLFNYNTAMYILSNILKVINFRYKNGYNNKYREDSESSQDFKGIIYL